MALQRTPHTPFLLFLGGLLSLFAVTLWYLGREDETRGMRLGGLLTLAGGAWVFLFTAQLSSTTLAAKVFWRVLTNAAILSVVIVWLAYVCWYTGRYEWLSRRVFAGLSLVPVSLLAFATVPDMRRLLFADAELVRVGSFVALDATYAPAFFAYPAVGYAVLGVSFLLLAGAAIQARGRFRWQIALLLSFATLPGTAVLVDLTGYAPVPGLDLGPVSAAVIAVAGAFSVVRFEWLELTPIARDQVFHSMADAVVVVDVDGRIVDLNRRAERVVGDAAGDAVGRQLSDLAPALAPALDAADEREQSEVAVDTPDGPRVFDLRLSSVTPSAGGRAGYALILHDITARKAAEDRADRRSRRIERLLRVVNDVAAARPAEAVFRRAADGGHEVFGADVCRIAVVDGDRFVPVASSADGAPDDLPPQPIDAGFAGSTYRAGEPIEVDDLTDVRGGGSHLVAADADPTYRSLLSAPIGDRAVVQLLSTEPGDFDEDDRELVSLFASHVATAVDRAEAESDVRDERDRFEKFASVVAHDLRNPLTIASGRHELLAADDDVPDDHVEPLGTALDRMESIITDLLTLARRGDAVGEVEPVDLSACVADAWATVDTGAAELRRADDLGRIRADRGRLQELFENLFRNSVEHGSTGNRPEAGDAVEHGSTSPRSQAPEDSEGSEIPRADGEAVDSVEHGSTGSRPGADDSEASETPRETGEAGDSVEHGSTSSREQPGDSAEHGPSDDAHPHVTGRVGSLDDAHGFYVADDGPGIPESERASVFEYGHSSADDGTGIGLAIVDGIVGAHGWEITVDDAADGGARFDVLVDR
jgi:PAS domain S-box-containing protein